jgi:hypothetical protein
MAKKIKKFADGGVLITPQPTSNSTYPFPNSGSSSGSMSSGEGPGVNQTFNIQPTASAAGQPQQQPQSVFKKGGQVKISKASSRGDGCAQRGKTRGRMV